MSSPTLRSVLTCLTKSRLLEVAGLLDVGLARNAAKDDQIEALAASRPDSLAAVLAFLLRDELKAICRAHSLDDGGRARAEIAERILSAVASPKARRTPLSEGPSVAPPKAPASARAPTDPTLPCAGDIAVVRHRQYFVEAVSPPASHGDHTLVSLVCLDDDAQGRRLDVLWELELGARVSQPESQGLGLVTSLDEPARFGAYLNTLQWGAVTATDAKLFQAPFRAGINAKTYQLTPLKKALELPRANLFIADDVGLGKTIEAGLVLQELILRQRVSWSLILCPAAVALQWQQEMRDRFGLSFAVYNRDFVSRRRTERGFAVNPWSTHSRFIVSYQTFRRPEHREPLLRHLQSQSDGRLPKSLLILDEAHTAAPASPSNRYAVDSRITRAVRGLAPLFENRLFLSATPHNGHSNSFSALLEILDPQRFTRGVAVTSPTVLEPVMVRRLKSDLRDIDEKLPARRIVRVELSHDKGRWQETIFGLTDTTSSVSLGEGEDIEIRLSALLAEYTALMRPEKGKGRLVFINLQKRLLSSVEAFHRTLLAHAEHLGKAGPVPSWADEANDDERGVDDEVRDAAEEAAVGAASGALPQAAGRARELLDTMLKLTAAHRHRPDAKVRALLHWLTKNACRGLALGEKKASWEDRRVIVFTEYGDTKRYLVQQLSAALADTDNGSKRIAQFHGGMSDDAREDVKRAFGSASSPVRILIATDAAREGVNLQERCADLFHYDVPWNPARMEQRNGRIDRFGQEQAEVRCAYFVYPQRPEDRVLHTLVDKVDVITKELGSLGQVLLERVGQALDDGIDPGAEERIEKASRADSVAREVVKVELEQNTRAQKRMKKEAEEAADIYDRSKERMHFDAVLLQRAVEMGLTLSGAKGELRLLPPEKGKPAPKTGRFELPELPARWDALLDELRPRLEPDEPPYLFRKKKPRPVIFEEPPRGSSDVYLHLHHPLVLRLLSRFSAQGYSAHDLSRVTVLRSDRAAAHVVAFGRLSLFGHDAARLHDELIAVVARWVDGGGSGHLAPLTGIEAERLLDKLRAELRDVGKVTPVGPRTAARFCQSAAGDFSALWPAVADEADDREADARQKLSARGGAEAEALRGILRRQREAIHKALGAFQLELPGVVSETERREREQKEDDKKHMEARFEAISREIEVEPRGIVRSYEVALRRLSPVGLVYLWPESR